jgi:ABC-type transport system involved in multi-copper enzyme maturation permease subunit/regulation of enolase protein 1 (concanavalin A-like superfamily)
MTAETTTTYRSALPAGHDGFAQLLRAEWTKFRTVRGWVIGAVVAVLLTLGLGLFAGFGGSSSCVSESSSGNGQARSGAACAPSLTTGPGGGPVTDSFYFVHQPLAGDGSITVRVTSLTGQLPDLTIHPSGAGQQLPMHAGLMSWAKAGLIIKDGTTEGSAYAAMMVTADHGVRMQADYTQDTPGLPGAVSAESPRWLRLTRSGDTITGYDSADGMQWTQVGSVRLAGLPTTVQVGLFTASPIDELITESFGGGNNGNEAPSQATAVFDHLGLAGSWTAGAWSGDYIGAGDYAPGIGSYHQVGGRFTVTGAGDIAPIPSGASAPGGPSITLTNLLIGTFAGLIAVIVVATLFITAEYRRGLIRVTLAASPRRGRALAAKAVGIGSASFVAGLVAAAAAVIVGKQVARTRQYVFPVSWVTELRLVVGTAALIAVVAALALAVGAMMRRSAAAVTTVVVAIVLPYLLAVASILPAGTGDWLLRLTPAAGFAVQQAATAYPQVDALYTPNGGYYPLAPWAGFAVLCGFAALAMTGAVILLRRRDA